MEQFNFQTFPGHAYRDTRIGIGLGGLLDSLVSYSTERVQLLALQLFPYHPHHPEVVIADPCHLLCNNALGLYRGKLFSRSLHVSRSK
jgi:hypothetical protein